MIAVMAAPPARVDINDVFDELQASAQRAVSWLLSHVNADGSIGDPENGFKYYRAPWTFTLLGQPDVASGICGWVRANLLTEHADLSAPIRTANDGWAYRDGTFITGAQMLNQHDLSLSLIPALLAWQDPISGAFANDHKDDGSMSDEMDIPYACGPGLALLMTGQLDAARRVAEFLDTIYKAQPALPDRFFCFWSRSRQRPIYEDDPDFELRFVVDNQTDRMQRWTIGGIAAAFLCRLYMADPQDHYLDLARRYQAFSMAATDAQFNYPSACKSSWGAALLYQITGEDRYREWLGRFARWYINSQEPDGYWHPWVEETRGDVIEITLEYAMHIATMSIALSSRPTP